MTLKRVAALDATELEDYRQLASEAFEELFGSVCTISMLSPNVERDPEFGNIIEDEPVTLTADLPYTMMLSQAFKELDGSGADFIAQVRYRIYIPSKAVKAATAIGGELNREKQWVTVNGEDYQMAAVQPLSQQHGKSVVYKVYLKQKEPAEQDQGNYGG